MKRLTCPGCRNFAEFERTSCRTCGLGLAFDPTTMQMTNAQTCALCSNRPHIACNWLVDDGATLCSSCSLTTTIPNLGLERNVVLWKKVERAKRRLIYDLRRLQLPLVTRSGMKLRFDILSEENTGQQVTTGHEAGLITLNVAEADDAEREARRLAFHEPYRTLLGHFRHEAAHFYWSVLIDEAHWLPQFRLLFGDERENYREALTNYYARPRRSFECSEFISEYASSHPWEDWAETFAHFLHIVATLDTAASLSLFLEGRKQPTMEDPYLERDFDALLAAWSPVAEGLNELNRSIGHGDAYPFDLSAAVKGKLHLVHMAILHQRDSARAVSAPRNQWTHSAVSMDVLSSR